MPSGTRTIAIEPGWKRGAVALALAGALVIAFSAILVALADVDPATAAVYRCLYALPPLVAVALWEDRRAGPRSWRARRAPLLAGVLLGADLVSWHYAIADVGAGLATVLANLQVVVIPLAAWALLGERVPRAVGLALPLVLTGVLLISGVLETGAYGRDPVRGVLFGLLCGLAYAGFILVLRQGSGAGRVAGPLLDATITAGLASLAFALVAGADLAPSWPAHGWLALLGVTSQVLGWLLIGSSLPRLPAALASMILTVQPVGSVALAMVLLGEEPSALQLAGVAGILGGLLVLALWRGGRVAPVGAAG